MDSRIDATSRLDAPSGVVDERRHAFDNVPPPVEGKLPEDVEVVPDERLAVQHDREEVHRKVRVVTGRPRDAAGSPERAGSRCHLVSIVAVTIVGECGADEAAERRCTLGWVLTIFTVPKPFRGHIGDIQRNSIASWIALGEDVQVVLIGDEEGVEQAARGAGVEHVGGLAHNDRGTPRLDSAFERAATVAEWPLWCYVNADVLLLDDFVPAVVRTASAFDEFLIIGECRDLDVVAEPRLRDPAVRSALRDSAIGRGRLRGYAALDYFVFPRGLFDPVPPFLIGRACFDNWLVWRVRSRGRPVVDTTRSIVAIHQSHDYSHVPGGLDEAYYGEEARLNELLAGGREHIFSLHDATHRLYSKGRPLPYWGAVFRARERARSAKVQIDIGVAARRARRTRPLRLLGVFASPTTEMTRVLDELAAEGDVRLTVLYATRAFVDTAPAQTLRHDRWFLRSVRVGWIDRALRREYPINWAIWRSFQAVRPDCMIVAGCSTFATQAAIAWCVARKVPYVLVWQNDERTQIERREGPSRFLVDAIARRAVDVLGLHPESNTSTPSHVASGVSPDAWDSSSVTATRLLEIGRAARSQRVANRSRTNVRRLHRHAASLMRSVTRRVRRRRTRFVSGGPSKRVDSPGQLEGDPNFPSS